MPAPVKDLITVANEQPDAQSEPEAIATRSDVEVFASVVERLASNPAVDVEKLKGIIELQERIMRHRAKAAFDRAFVKMRPGIPVIIERGKTDKSTYAPLEDIIEPITPILAQHGFYLDFRTEWPDSGKVRIVGILTHEEGHSRESSFEAGADTSGSKNAIQALASTVSYGKRYTTSDLVCIVTRGADDDGHRGGLNAPEPPEGFDDWWADLSACADNGWKALETAWKKSKAEYRTYADRFRTVQKDNLKAKAQAADKRAAEAGRA